MEMSRLRLALAIAAGLAAAPALAQAQQDQGASDLAKAAQNPISDVISLPLQNNLNFGVGPENRQQNVLNIQPVLPISLNENWNVISRTIVPVISQPTLPGEREFGIGDINPTFFFSPKKPFHGVIWGLGPTVVLPTGSDKSLTSGKYSVGPAFVALTIQGPWVMGFLLNNVWSVGGRHDRPDVNQMTLQPFINYNFRGGWYLTTSPIITANWKAAHGDRWTVPLGGGFGRVFKIGKQPVNMQLGAYDNVAKPTGGADWQLRAQFQFLFPK